MASLTLLRNATVLLSYAGTTFLVDPMLNDAGAVSAIPGTAPNERNPLVELPRPAADVAAAADAVLVTHLHNDHFDDAARSLLPNAVPLLCQPPDADRLRGDGFTDVRPVEPAATIGAVSVDRVVARHTLGEHAEALGPGSGYVLRADGEPTVYVAGDCVWCEEMAATLDEFRPDVVVLNGGAARFLTGAHISMTSSDVIAAARHADGAQIVVVHLEALNHCPMTRDELRRHATAAGLVERVRAPADGTSLTF
jgi:L-ascorbate metabolism protein UlaG (beta-lactamase superfamily)